MSTRVDDPHRRLRPETVVRDILAGSGVISIVAVILALAAGAVLIAVTDRAVQNSAAYFFSRPFDTVEALGRSIAGAYSALFQGSIINFRKDNFAEAVQPLGATMTFATPVIAAGLGVGVAFRVGLFNIGGRGQILIGAACAGWVAWSFVLPPGIHLALAGLAGVVGAALWGGIAGLLKARTGAHEVIVTIMLNYIAFYLVAYLLRTPGALQAPGATNPKSPPTAPSAIFPPIFESGPLNLSFIVVIVVTLAVSWLLNRSSLGFRFRAVGINSHAARVAGINVKNMYVYAMLISGGLVGFAGVTQVLSSVTTGFGSGIDAGIGFDAITVALLGRSKPLGIFAAGILFGAFKAGGFAMQASQGIPVDIVLVIQALIVLFIAAPPLVRAIFRLPAPSARVTIPRGREVGAAK